jgi:type III restriction enzyme
LNSDFQELWNRIQHRTRYAVTYSTASLIDRASAAIGQMPEIKKPRLIATKSRVIISDEGVTGELLAAKQLEMPQNGYRAVPDLLSYLQRETELTRKTLAEILINSGRLADVSINPQQFLDQALSAVKRTLHQMIVDGIKYEKVNGHVYEMLLFEEKEIESYANRMVDVTNGLYDCVEIESDIEREFAEAMSTRQDIKLIIKLPDWFRVETPIGTYNPDWAIVKQEDEKLYLVRETKSTKEQQKLRQSEWDKIRCGKAHFDALDVDFKHITAVEQV